MCHVFVAWFSLRSCVLVYLCEYFCTSFSVRIRMSERSLTRQVRLRKRTVSVRCVSDYSIIIIRCIIFYLVINNSQDIMEGLTFQEQADIQRAMYASLHMSRHHQSTEVPSTAAAALPAVSMAGGVGSTAGATVLPDRDREPPPPVKRKRGRPRKFPLNPASNTGI